jgi:hypothetical protein
MRTRRKILKKAPQGARGGPNFLFNKILFFCDLKPHAKFQNPTITLLGENCVAQKEKRKEKN